MGPPLLPRPPSAGTSGDCWPVSPPAAFSPVPASPFYSHEASLRGLSSTATATVFSIFALSQLLAFPVMGWLAPRLGVTRLYRIGLLLAGITTVVFGLLTYVERPTPRV